MDENNKTNINGQDDDTPGVDNQGKDEGKDQIIKDLNVPPEVIEEAEVIDKKTFDEATSGPEDKPNPKDSAVEDYTKALVSTLDIVQSKVCNVIARRTDIDFNLNDKDTEKLIVIWKPVVAKWYYKIPVELVALVSSVSVLTSQFAYAQSQKADKKK